MHRDEPSTRYATRLTILSPPIPLRNDKRHPTSHMNSERPRVSPTYRRRR